MPAEIHHQLLGLPGIEPEMVLLAPVHKVLNKFSVGSVIPDEADDSRVIREVLWMAVRGLVGEVCSALGEQERGQDCSLWATVPQIIVFNT